MADKAELIMCHGWGFSRGCWKLWEEALSSHNIAIIFFDRGYFGEPAQADFTRGDHPKIIFVHSFGLHLCASEQLEDADLLVIFGGFQGFHPRAAQFQRRSRLLLQQMIQKFQNNPEIVLKDFLKNVYYPDNAPNAKFTGLNADKLLDDLKTLDQSEFDNGPLKKTGKICILHGSRDGIVPKAKGRELYNQSRKKATYFEIKDAGHALPFTHMDQCLAFIEPDLNDLLNS